MTSPYIPSHNLFVHLIGKSGSAIQRVREGREKEMKKKKRAGWEMKQTDTNR